jgi:clan AA aspartic protease (TIGR02281 family)
MRIATEYTLLDGLIVVPAMFTGARGSAPARLVLDTGASFTTITHELADSLGYSARDGHGLARVTTAVGVEHGYFLRVATIEVLGFALRDIEVHVFDLGHRGIDGLLGMSFLRFLNFDVRPTERRILGEPAAA